MSIPIGNLHSVDPVSETDLLPHQKVKVGRPRTTGNSHLSQAERMTRAEKDHEIVLREKRLARLKKRADPIDPLRTAVLYSTLGLNLLILAASGIFSFATIASVGAWLMPAQGWLVWLLPIATEFFIVFGGLDTLISQARQDRRGAIIGLVVMIAASAVAVVANASHVIAGWQASGEFDWRAWVAIVIASLIPVGSVVASKRAISLVFDKGE